MNEQLSRKAICRSQQQTRASIAEESPGSRTSRAREIAFRTPRRLNGMGTGMIRRGFAKRLAPHAQTDARNAPSVTGKTVSPHLLRHTCAIHSLEATGDVRKLSHRFGHSSLQTTGMYLQADPTAKLDTPDKSLPPSLRKGRFKGVQDELLDARKRLDPTILWESDTSLRRRVRSVRGSRPAVRTSRRAMTPPGRDPEDSNPAARRMLDNRIRHRAVRIITAPIVPRRPQRSRL